MSSKTRATAAHTKERHPDAGAAVRRATASSNFRPYANVEPGISVRNGLGYEDWDYFRPEQAPPLDPKGKMAACLQAHERFGEIRNVIDMMAEFACSGIDLVHEDPSTERFYKEWWRKINDGAGGTYVTERMLNLLYRAGTVPMKRVWGTLTPNQGDLVKRGLASNWDSNNDVRPDVGGKARPRRIPWRYTILNPLSLEILATPDIAPLMGQTALNYGVRINRVLIDLLKEDKTKQQFPIFRQELDTLLSEIGSGQIVPVPPEDLTVLFYKKDDWQVWPTPMLFSLYRDLQSLGMLKLADMSALDGAASHVRVWKLGNIEKEFWPSPDIVDKFADLLATRSPGQVLDVVWSPDIDLIETKSDLHNFLGPEKYYSVWAAIYGGLGIPMSLTGVPGAAAAGTTNNWVSLKTLVERLEYGRRVAASYWEQEVRLVQRAMGFRKPPRLTFDRQSLSDEAAILRLFIELMDRNVVSREAVQERFSLIPEIEAVRSRREGRRADKGLLPKKGGPWDDPNFEHNILLNLIKLQRITPGQAGVELADDPKLPASKQGKMLPPLQPAKPPASAPGGDAPPSGGKGEPGVGRPPASTDSKPRKTPRFAPRAALVRAELARLGLEDPHPDLVADVALAMEDDTPAGVHAAVLGVFGQSQES